MTFTVIVCDDHSWKCRLVLLLYWLEKKLTLTTKTLKDRFVVFQSHLKKHSHIYITVDMTQSGNMNTYIGQFCKTLDYVHWRFLFVLADIFQNFTFYKTASVHRNESTVRSRERLWLWFIKRQMLTAGLWSGVNFGPLHGQWKYTLLPIYALNWNLEVQNRPNYT